jgi:hypothetical protein
MTHPVYRYSKAFYVFMWGTILTLGCSCTTQQSRSVGRCQHCPHCNDINLEEQTKQIVRSLQIAPLVGRDLDMSVETRKDYVVLGLSMLVHQYSVEELRKGIVAYINGTDTSRNIDLEGEYAKVYLLNRMLFDVPARKNTTNEDELCHHDDCWPLVIANNGETVLSGPVIFGNISYHVPNMIMDFDQLRKEYGVRKTKCWCKTGTVLITP